MLPLPKTHLWMLDAYGDSEPAADLIGGCCTTTPTCLGSSGILSGTKILKLLTVNFVKILLSENRGRIGWILFSSRCWKMEHCPVQMLTHPEP